MQKKKSILNLIPKNALEIIIVIYLIVRKDLI